MLPLLLPHAPCLRKSQIPDPRPQIPVRRSQIPDPRTQNTDPRSQIPAGDHGCTESLHGCTEGFRTWLYGRFPYTAVRKAYSPTALQPCSLAALQPCRQQIGSTLLFKSPEVLLERLFQRRRPNKCCCGSVSQSVSQSLGQPVSPSVSESVGQAFSQAVGQPASQSGSQSASQSVRALPAQIGPTLLLKSLEMLLERWF